MKDINNKSLFIGYFLHEYINKYGEDFIDALECDYGTGEWQAAFESACNHSDNKELIDYCKLLKWDEYDEFSLNISKFVLKNITSE